MSIPYYTKLDQLQNRVFDLFTSLGQLPDLDDDEANYQTSYNNITLEIDKLLIAYKDYLRLLKSKDKSNTLKTYELKYQSLKQKLRNLQVYINDQKQDKLHDYRIKHFHLEEKPKEDIVDNETSARDQLFANRSQKLQKESELSINQQIVQQNKQITQSLQTSRQLLSASILQSELNIENLDQQTKDLYKLNENFLQFNDLLNKSKQIVKFIEKQDKADRQRIYLSIGFFIICCCWVVYRRILRRPIKILLWSLFKIFNIFGWLFGGGNNSVVQAPVKLSTTEILMSTVIDATSSLVEEVSKSTNLIESIVESLSTGESIIESLASTVSERIVDEL